MQVWLSSSQYNLTLINRVAGFLLYSMKKTKNGCKCNFCGKSLPGFVECNCDNKFQNRDLWARKIGRRSKTKAEKMWR